MTISSLREQHQHAGFVEAALRYKGTHEAVFSEWHRTEAIHRLQCLLALSIPRRSALPVHLLPRNLGQPCLSRSLSLTLKPFYAHSSDANHSARSRIRTIA